METYHFPSSKGRLSKLHTLRKLPLISFNALLFIALMANSFSASSATAEVVEQTDFSPDYRKFPGEIISNSQSSKDVDGVTNNDRHFSGSSAKDGPNGKTLKPPIETTIPNSRHHISRRSFDSLAAIRGMDQNFVGPMHTRSPDMSSWLLYKRLAQVLSQIYGHDGWSSPSRSKRQMDDLSLSGFFGGMNQNYVPFPVTHRSRGKIYPWKFEHLEKRTLSGNDESRDELLRDAPSKRFGFTLDSSGLSGMNQNYVSKRQFDILSSGKFGGMDQNYLGKRNLDYLSSGSLGGLGQNFVGKRFSNDIPHKRFHSLSSGSLGGFGQNFVKNKKRIDSLSSSGFSEMGQNFAGKRDFYMPSKRFDSLSSAPFGGFKQNFLSKKYFDSFGSGGFSKMGQNFVMKRPHISSKRFDSLSSGSFGGLGQNFVSKKHFDSFGSGGSFSNMGQNFIKKRSADHFRTKRFDSLSSGSFGGLGQNFLSKKHFDSFGSGVFSGMGQNFVSKKSADNGTAKRLGTSGNKSKKHFGSLASGRFSGMGQNFVARRIDTIPVKRFDSLSSGTFGNLGQNFVSKKRFGSLGSSSLSGMGQNYVGKRLYPFGSGSFGGLGQNYQARKRFGSLASGFSSGMNQNFVGKRFPKASVKRFDSLSSGSFGGLGQNFVSNKKRFDSFRNGGLSGMGQNFVGKRFDSLSSGSFGGLGQNFLGNKRFETLASAKGFGMGQNFVSKKSVGIFQDSGKHEVPSNSPILTAIDEPTDKLYYKSTDADTSAPKSLSKRNLDSLAMSHMGNMGQHFIGQKRYGDLSMSGLGGFNQNFIRKRPFHSLDSGTSFPNMHQHYISKRNNENIDNNNIKSVAKRSLRGQFETEKTQDDSSIDYTTRHRRSNPYSKMKKLSNFNKNHISSLNTDLYATVQNIMDKRSFHGLSGSGFQQNILSGSPSIKRDHSSPLRSENGQKVDLQNLAAKLTSEDNNDDDRTTNTHTKTDHSHLKADKTTTDTTKDQQATSWPDKSLR